MVLKVLLMFSLNCVCIGQKMRGTRNGRGAEVEPHPY